MTVKGINFSRSKRGLVRADRFPEYIEVDPKLAGYASSVMDVIITFRCANGSAEYLVTGLSEGGNFIAQKVQQEPMEILTLNWPAEEGEAMGVWTNHVRQKAKRWQQTWTEAALDSEKQEPLTLQDVEEDKWRLVEQAVDYWKRRAEKTEHELMIARETIRTDRKSLAATEAQVARLADPALVDLLAAYAHHAWASWTTWMIDKWDDIHKETGEPFQKRWKRQVWTEYKDLSEAEKESDRQEAQAILDIIWGHVNDNHA